MMDPTFWTLVPRARPVYVQMFDQAAEVLPRFGLDTELRLSHFLAQVLHETGGLTILEEHLNYSAERLRVVWPSRFRTVAAAVPYARNPEALANRVYGGRLGNVLPGDGWLFRGRGLLQITGRSNYEAVGDVLGFALETLPEQAVLPTHGLAIAACLWHLRGANAAADTDDVKAVTKRINGGQIGLADRELWLGQVRHLSVSV